MPLNHISHTGNPKQSASQYRTSRYPHTTPIGGFAVINPLMHLPALSSVAILAPYLLQMDKRTLPGTIDKMLKGR
jgi:hypothetical protein